MHPFLHVWKVLLSVVWVLCIIFSVVFDRQVYPLLVMTWVYTQLYIKPMWIRCAVATFDFLTVVGLFLIPSPGKDEIDCLAMVSMIIHAVPIWLATGVCRACYQNKSPHLGQLALSVFNNVFVLTNGLRMTHNSSDTTFLLAAPLLQLFVYMNSIEAAGFRPIHVKMGLVITSIGILSSGLNLGNLIENGAELSYAISIFCASWYFIVIYREYTIEYTDPESTSWYEGKLCTDECDKPCLVCEHQDESVPGFHDMMMRRIHVQIFNSTLAMVNRCYANWR